MPSRKAKTASEKSIVTNIVAYLHGLHSSWVFKVHGGLFQLAGIPDILCVYDGKLFAFEVKDAHGKASQIQLVTLSKIKRAGGYAAVVRSVAEVREMVESATLVG
jgi:penicillin-binding protein-related factor A (putative recombinase)